MTVRQLRKRGVGFTADLLGEAVISDHEAEVYIQTCVDLLRGLAGTPEHASPKTPGSTATSTGRSPASTCRSSSPASRLGLTPFMPTPRLRRVADRLRPILRVAREVGAFVNVDMEQYAHKDLTYAIFRAVLSEPEFRDWADVGIVAQAYLPEAEGDLHDLADWATDRGTPVTVRLVKGAYWDYETTMARQLGWPVPVYAEKWASDASFERCARFLMEEHDVLRPALGSHNIRSLSFALATAEALGVPKNGYDIQMLHGMGGPAEAALVRRGYRVRVYTPYGAMLPGMAYLVRRLLENTSNESFLKASHGGRADADALLRNPEEVGSMLLSRRKKASPASPPVGLAPFRNEPLTDFTRPEARVAMADALARVKGWLGGPYFPTINGEAIKTGAVATVTAPGDHALVVSRTAMGTATDADRAVAAARSGFAKWSKVAPRDRAEVLLRAAAILRSRRFELAAWEVFECGKPWREADGDVAEAIDFCEFYAREMIRLAEPTHRDVPGETNAIDKIARGRGRGHSTLELPAGDSDGNGGRRPGCRQRRDPQASRAVSGDGLAPVLRSSAKPGAPAGFAFHFLPWPWRSGRPGVGR